MMRGQSPDLEDGEFNVVGDRGYSFCNCRNIFFIDWKNIDTRIYDEDYIKRYTESDAMEQKVMAEKNWKIVNQHCPNATDFLEIGASSDIVPDTIKSKSFKKINFKAMDMIQRESKYPLIITDFEQYVPSEKFDVIWATQFFEHLHYPKRAVKTFSEMLKPGGVVYLTMPDTHYIDWHDPLSFAWNVLEHHTLWNIHDFVKFVEEESDLKCVYKKLSTDTYKAAPGVTRWIMESRTIFKKQQ